MKQLELNLVKIDSFEKNSKLCVLSTLDENWSYHLETLIKLRETIPLVCLFVCINQIMILPWLIILNPLNS